jgi:hypothetical protein
VPTVKGYMGTDFIPRKATLWRLTEHRTNAAGPTRDYLDADIADAERAYNLYLARITSKNAASLGVRRASITRENARDYGKSLALETAGSASHDVERSSSCPSHPMRHSIAGRSQEALSRASGRGPREEGVRPATAGTLNKVKRNPAETREVHRPSRERGLRTSS